MVTHENSLVMPPHKSYHAKHKKKQWRKTFENCGKFYDKIDVL